MNEDIGRKPWVRALGCLAAAAILAVPAYFLLTILGGLLYMAEGQYWATHRTPVRYLLPKGFRGKGEVDFNVEGGETMEWDGRAVVFRIPASGRLRLRSGYDAVPSHRDIKAFQGGKRLPTRGSNGDDAKGSVPPVGIGFYDRMNDDANPANGYDDANRSAFFVGTHEEFVRGVKTGKIKAWE